MCWCIESPSKSESSMTLKQEHLLAGTISISTSRKKKYWTFSSPDDNFVVGSCLILATASKIVVLCSESAPVPIPRHTDSKFRATRQFGGVSKTGTDGS